MSLSKKTSSPVLGIDFGTSNSTVGLALPHRAVQMVALEGQSTSIPTCLFFNSEPDHDGAVHFGREAIGLYKEGFSGRLLRALKSILGSSLAHEQTVIGYKSLKLMDVLQLFIAELKQKAEAAAGEPLDSAVVGRPVYFVDGKKDADTEAEEQLRSVLQAAGFKHIRFQFEPVAAALTYESTLNKEELVLVADLGGGTADFSLITLSPKHHKKEDRREDIHGNAGVHIGGTDLDRVLSLKGLMPALGYGSALQQKGLVMPNTPYVNLSTWHKINLLYTGKVMREIEALLDESAEPEKVERLMHILEDRKGHALIGVIEDVKIALTDAEAVEADFDPLLPAYSQLFTRSQFNDAIDPLLIEIVSTIDHLLTTSGHAKDEVTTLFFTGGTSAVPAVRQAICALLPRAQVIDGDPMAAVGQGLAIDAQQRGF